MEQKFQLCFNSEYPDIGSFETCVQAALALNQLADRYTVQDIIDQACQRCENAASTDAIIEIQIAWFSTICLEIIQELSQAYCKYRFDQAVQVLFIGKELSALKFLATIQRLLYQHRLSQAYEPREIIAEAYSRGIRSIVESGNLIEIPEAWLRSTCLNVIRELQRKQKQAETPNLDSESWLQGDQSLSELMLGEDHAAVRLAMQRLSREEREILALRVDQQLSWQAIGAVLLNAKRTPLGENAARQRGFRAFLKLRQHFIEIRETVRVSETD